MGPDDWLKWDGAPACVPMESSNLIQIGIEMRLDTPQVIESVTDVIVATGGSGMEPLRALLASAPRSSRRVPSPG